MQFDHWMESFEAHLKHMLSVVDGRFIPEGTYLCKEHILIHFGL